MDGRVRHPFFNKNLYNYINKTLFLLQLIKISVQILKRFLPKLSPSSVVYYDNRINCVL